MERVHCEDADAFYGPCLALLATQTLASIATGDLKYDVLYLLLHELTSVGDAARALVAQMGLDADSVAALLSDTVTPIGRSCSMFGAWGSRTVNGDLVSGRNLDWQADTGVSKHKVRHLPGFLRMSTSRVSTSRWSTSRARSGRRWCGGDWHCACRVRRRTLTQSLSLTHTLTLTCSAACDSVR